MEISDLQPDYFTSTAVITAGTSLSAASTAIAKGMCIVGLVIPGTWTAAKVSLQGSYDGTNYAEVATPGQGGDIYASATLTPKSSTAIYLALDPAMMIGLRTIKVQSGVLGTGVNQGSAATIKVICRPVL